MKFLLVQFKHSNGSEIAFFLHKLVYAIPQDRNQTLVALEGHNDFTLDVPFSIFIETINRSLALHQC